MRPSPTHALRPHALPLIASLSLATFSLAGAAQTTCEARSPAAALPVVELYTSEGCNSCPPADRWASTLKGRSDVIALAFHVDYWDRLGWKDRFASPAYTQRQAQLVNAGAARFAYTPQVLLNGQDWRGWGAAVPRSSGPAAARITLRRSGDAIEASVQAEPAALGRTEQFSAYWAVIDDGWRSDVKAGENAGVTLLHDNVVQRYVPVAAWPAGQPQSLRLTDLPPAGEAREGHPRRTVLVVQDAGSLRPVQALALGC